AVRPGEAPRASRRSAGDRTSHGSDEPVTRDGHAALVREGRGRDAGAHFCLTDDLVDPSAQLKIRLFNSSFDGRQVIAAGVLIVVRIPEHRDLVLLNSVIGGSGVRL